MTTFERLPDQPVGELVATRPGAAELLRRHGVPVCRAAQRRLADAAPPDALPEIEAALAALPADDPPADTDALIDHILARYHDVHRRELPELIRLAQTVEAVHATHPEVPDGLADLLARMAWDMESHMQKEEDGLFPGLRDGHASPMAMELMRDEHDEHGVRLRELEALTRGHAPPAGACDTWCELYAGTAKLTDDLIRHIHLENAVLFPRFGG